MKSRIFAGALLGAALAFVGGMPQQALPSPRTMQVAQRRRHVRTGFSAPVTLVGTRYSRRTVAMDKRAASKRRNQRRNKSR